VCVIVKYHIQYKHFLVPVPLPVECFGTDSTGSLHQMDYKRCRGNFNLV